MRLVGVELEKNGRMHHFQAGDLKLEKGDLVVVDAEKGITLGTIVTPPKEEKVGLFKRSIPEVIRTSRHGRSGGKKKRRHSNCVSGSSVS